MEEYSFLKILRDPTAGKILSVVIGISIVVIFIDFCSGTCLIVNAPKFKDARSFEKRTDNGRCVKFEPIMTKTKMRNMFVEFA